MEAVLKRTELVASYKPSFIHTVYQWIDQFPGPYWLLSVFIVLFTGALNHVVAWQHNVLVPYEIDWSFALTGFYLAFNLFVNDFLSRVAKESLAESRHILNVSEEEFQQILFEFIHLPAKFSAFFFSIGAIVGFAMGWVLLPTAPEMNNAFPELELTMYTLSMGLIFITLFGIVRSLRLISRLFDKDIHVDIFNQGSIYAMSRYSAWLIFTVSIQVSLTFVIIPTFAEITALYFIVFSVVVYSLILAIFWLPLRGINKKMKMKKQSMLQEINQRIKTTFDLLNTKIDKQEFVEIRDLREVIESLKSEKAYIESIRTWPWKPSTITGLLSVVLLPFIGSLLVEIVTKLLFSN